MSLVFVITGLSPQWIYSFALFRKAACSLADLLSLFSLTTIPRIKFLYALLEMESASLRSCEVWPVYDGLSSVCDGLSICLFLCLSSRGGDRVNDSLVSVMCSFWLWEGTINSLGSWRVCFLSMKPLGKGRARHSFYCAVFRQGWGPVFMNEEKYSPFSLLYLPWTQSQEWLASQKPNEKFQYLASWEGIPPVGNCRGRDAEFLGAVGEFTPILAIREGGYFGSNDTLTFLTEF